MQTGNLCMVFGLFLFFVSTLLEVDAEGTCELCPVDLSCINCGSDTYSTTISATSVDTCDACPSHSVSDYGSNALDDCSCIGGYVYKDSP
jgi:hypothetical protein